MPGQQHDAIGEIDRLGDVVGDEQHGAARALPHAQQLVLQAGARDRVERAERLVEQQQVGIDRERARQGDALALAARQLIRPALRIVGEADQLERGTGASGALGARQCQALEAELDVGEHAAPWQQARLLEHQPDRPPLTGRRAGQRDPSGGRPDQPGEHAQQARLADPRRADHGDELAGLERQVEALQHHGAAGAGAIAERDAVERRYGCHASARRRTSSNSVSVMP